MARQDGIGYIKKEKARRLGCFGMLPPDRTVKKITVESGGIFVPSKTKATAEEKQRIVEEYLSGEAGWAQACEKNSIVQSTFGEWVRRYKTEGPSGFLPQEQNRSYSKEIKLAAVVEYLPGQGSLQSICERYQIRSAKQLRNWIKKYNRHENLKESNGGAYMAKGRETTLSERLEIVRECIAHENNYGATALKYQVSYQQVYTWTKKYCKMGEAGLEDRRGRRAGSLPSRTPEEELRDKIALLERKNFNLEMENTLLKKVRDLERRRR